MLCIDLEGKREEGIEMMILDYLLGRERRRESFFDDYLFW